MASKSKSTGKDEARRLSHGGNVTSQTSTASISKLSSEDSTIPLPQGSPSTTSQKHPAPLTPMSSSSSINTQNTASAQTSTATTSTHITTPITATSSSGIATPAGGSGQSSRDLIKVCVRVRPPVIRDDRHDPNDSVVWKWDRQSIAPSIITPIRKGATNSFSTINAEYFLAQQSQYSFDHVFAPETTTNTIFDEVIRDIVSSAMNGMHGSVFMYGQTASGKTFTMNGVSNQHGQQGIIPQAVHACFDSVELFPDREFLIRVSYLEVYNEQLKDLLSTETATSSPPIKILHDPKQGTILTGVKEQVVLNFAQVTALIKHGETQRHVGVTDMNEKSSRAHTLFKIIIESKDRNHKHGPVRVSTLNLVDLAGSESAKMTNSKGQRLQEARHINQSLLALSTIIQRLSEDHSHHPNQPNKRSQHLPFRDSKLTRLLETALDGNGKIAIICTISPTLRCVEETANTLKFGTRAKLIQMHAKINETVDDKTLLRAYREEIEQLKQRLKELEERNRSAVTVSGAMDDDKHLSDRLHHHLHHSQKREEGDDKDGTSDSENSTRSSETETRSGGSGGAHRQETNEDEDEEDPTVAAEQNAMLQMILEMERLILKADMTKSQQLQLQETAQQLVQSAATSISSTPPRASTAAPSAASTNSSSSSAPAAALTSSSPAVRGKNGEKRLSLAKLSTLSSRNVLASTQSKGQLTKQASSHNIKAIDNNSAEASSAVTKPRPIGTETAAASSTTPLENDDVSKQSKASTVTPTDVEGEVSSKDTAINAPSPSADVVDAAVVDAKQISNGAATTVTETVSSETTTMKTAAAAESMVVDSDKSARPSFAKEESRSIMIDTSDSSLLPVELSPNAKEEIATERAEDRQTLASSGVVSTPPPQITPLSLSTASHLLAHRPPAVSSPDSTTGASTPSFIAPLNTPRLASVYSQMESTAIELGVAPPTLPQQHQHHMQQHAHASHNNSHLPHIPSHHYTPQQSPHPQLLLLSPARQRLQQHLQQQQQMQMHQMDPENDSPSSDTSTNTNSADLHGTDIGPSSSTSTTIREENDSVLLNVSKMLLLLKDYIARPKSTSHNNRTQRKSTGGNIGRLSDPTGGLITSADRRSPPLLSPSPPAVAAVSTSPGNSTEGDAAGTNTHNPPSNTGLKKSSSHDHALAQLDVNIAPHGENNNNTTTPSTSASTSFSPLLSPARRPLSYSFSSSPARHSLGPAPSAFQPTASFTLGNSFNNHSQNNLTAGIISLEELHSLRLDLKLKEADNQFLQDEVENKDKMLSLLTEGLKEVEESQRQWLRANRALAHELSYERQINMSLWMEIDRLHAVLQQHNLIEELQSSPLWQASQGALSTQSADLQSQQQSRIPSKSESAPPTIEPTGRMPLSVDSGDILDSWLNDEPNSLRPDDVTASSIPSPVSTTVVDQGTKKVLGAKKKTADQFESY